MAICLWDSIALLKKTANTARLETQGKSAFTKFEGQLLLVIPYSMFLG